MWCPSLIIGNSGTEAASEVSATSTTVPPGSVTVSASLNAPADAEHSSTAANSVPACFAYCATEISLVSMTTSAPTSAAACRRPAERPAPTIGPTPASLSAMIAYRPLGPHPYTSTGSPGPPWASFTACDPPDSGSACDPTSTGTSSGSATSCRAGTLTYCAYAPGMVMPMFSTTGQRNGSPRAQILQVPQDPMGDAATGCPSAQPDTSEPRATIRPLNSCPSNCPGAHIPFCTKCTSDPHSPQASTATITSAGPGVGSGTSPIVVPVSLSTYRTARTGFLPFHALIEGPPSRGSFLGGGHCASDTIACDRTRPGGYGGRSSGVVIARPIRSLAIGRAPGGTGGRPPGREQRPSPGARRCARRPTASRSRPARAAAGG